MLPLFCVCLNSSKTTPSIYNQVGLCNKMLKCKCNSITFSLSSFFRIKLNYIEWREPCLLHTFGHSTVYNIFLFYTKTLLFDQIIQHIQFCPKSHKENKLLQTPQVKGHACLKQDKEQTFVEFFIRTHEWESTSWHTALCVRINNTTNQDMDAFEIFANVFTMLSLSLLNLYNYHLSVLLSVTTIPISYFVMHITIYFINGLS